MGYSRSTPINVIFAEAKMAPMKIRNRVLGKNYLIRALSSAEHPLISLLREAMELVEHPTLINRSGIAFIVTIFEEIERMAYLLPVYKDSSKFKFDFTDI